MKRRDFFKAVAGVFGISAKAKSETKTLFCKGKGGTLCPRCKFNIESAKKATNPPMILFSTEEEAREFSMKRIEPNIDPNSEWAKECLR